MHALGALNPSATHWAIHPLTAFWQDRSCSSVCFRSIGSVTVGGYFLNAEGLSKPPHPATFDYRAYFIGASSARCDC